MAQGKAVLRRPPKQERSRERVEEILQSAKQLIGEKGVDAVKMRDIATLAGGPISSIYQYFPNKSAIVATLYGKWSEEITRVLGSRLETANSLEDLYHAATALLDFYYRRISSDPAILDLLNAVQADKALTNIDITETRTVSGLFCGRAKAFVVADRWQEFERVAFLMFQLANGAVRLALAVEPSEAAGILADYKSMIRTQLTAFAAQPTR
jgi:AcrR family transcriptional regulator